MLIILTKKLQKLSVKKGEDEKIGQSDYLIKRVFYKLRSSCCNINKF